MSPIETAAETALTVAAAEIAGPLRAWKWAREHSGLMLGGLGIALGLALAGMGAMHYLAGGKAVEAQANVASATGTAMRDSGTDAVNTVTHEITREHDIERTVTNAQSAVLAAPDGAAADAAGRSGLCSITADLCPAPAMQQPDPR